jgi:hypothetical protein
MKKAPWLPNFKIRMKKASMEHGALIEEEVRIELLEREFEEDKRKNFSVLSIVGLRA